MNALKALKALKAMPVRDMRHQCIITRGGKVVSIGYNKSDTFVFNGLIFSRHAECDAILNLPRKYRSKKHGKSYKLDITVIRDDLGESKPCEQCVRFMRCVSFKIRNIRYSTAANSSTTLPLVKERLRDIKSEHVCTYWRLHAEALSMNQLQP